MTARVPTDNNKNDTSLIQDPSKINSNKRSSSKRALRVLSGKKKAKSRPLARSPRIQSAFIVSKVLAAIPPRCFLSHWKHITITGEFLFLARQSSTEVTNQSTRGFPPFLVSPDTLPIHTHIYTRKHIHVYEASKHRRLNLANRFRLDRALFFRRELHWLRRTLITIREDCSNSTSLVPTLGLPSLTPLACCAPWERVAGRGACSFLLLPPSRPSHSPQVEKRTAENCATRKLELVEEIYYGQPSTLTLTIPFSFLSSCLSAPIHGRTRFYIDGGIITIWMLAGHLYRFVYLLSRFEKYRRDMDWGNKIKKQSECT